MTVNPAKPHGYFVRSMHIFIQNWLKICNITVAQIMLLAVGHRFYLIHLYIFSVVENEYKLHFVSKDINNISFYLKTKRSYVYLL